MSIHFNVSVFWRSHLWAVNCEDRLTSFCSREVLSAILSSRIYQQNYIIFSHFCETSWWIWSCLVRVMDLDLFYSNLLIQPGNWFFFFFIRKCSISSSRRRHCKVPWLWKSLMCTTGTSIFSLVLFFFFFVLSIERLSQMNI